MSAYDWTTVEAFDLLDVLTGWWEKNRYRLHRQFPTPFGSDAESVRRTVNHLVNALAALFLHASPSDESSDGADTLRALISDLREHGVPATRLEAAAVRVLGMQPAEPLGPAAAALLDSRRNHVGDALEAAKLAANTLPVDARHEFDSVAVKLVQGVEWRHAPSLAQRLRVVGDLVDTAAWILTEEREAALLEGIRQIADETASGVKGNDEDGVIEVRAAAASLALALHRRREALGLASSEVTENWHDLCASADEFAEVRNAWSNPP